MGKQKQDTSRSGNIHTIDMTSGRPLSELSERAEELVTNLVEINVIKNTLLRSARH